MPFFSFLTPFPSAFEGHCSMCNSRFYEKDSTIFRAGTLGTKIYYLAAGTIRLEDIALPDSSVTGAAPERRRLRTSQDGIANVYSSMRAIQERLDGKKNFHVKRQRRQHK